MGGAIGVEMLGGYLAYITGMGNVSYLIVTTLEESLEMLGIVVFIHGLISCPVD
jgi:hypothetical protein